VKVFVITDMEGVSGIVKPEQTGAGEALYEEGRKLYTQDINAAVRGAKAAGATEIVVMDCHGAGKDRVHGLSGAGRGRRALCRDACTRG
jgi:D-amino peptidase